jgi:hypothetical protein
LKKNKKDVKNAEFHVDFESVEKVVKNAPKKVLSKISLTNKSKSEKSAFFRHIFANNFFGAFFQNFLNGFEIRVKFCVFLHLYLNFSKKIYLGHIRTFFKL